MSDPLRKSVQQWCQKHWQPIADTYKEGTPKSEQISGIGATVYLMTTVFGDEEMQQRAGFSETGGNKADPSLMNVLVAEVSPLCCWIGDDGMKQLYEDCKLTRPHVDCSKCGVMTFPGGYDRKTKQTIWLHLGGAWDCEQYKELLRQKRGNP